MSKPSLMDAVRSLHQSGLDEYAIARRLGIYVARIRQAIAHIEAEKKADSWKPMSQDFSLLEARVLAHLASGRDPQIVPPSMQGGLYALVYGDAVPVEQPVSPTRRIKPRMTPTQYYQAAKELAEKNRKAHEEEEAKKAALREINPIAYVQALESEDLLDLMTHASRELSIRNGKNYPQT